MGMIKLMTGIIPVSGAPARCLDALDKNTTERFSSSGIYENINQCFYDILKYQ
jgi:hypothetical protein